MLMLAAIYVLFIVTYAPSLLVKMVNYFSWRDHPICNPLNYQSDKRYKNPTLHIIAYVINWATVVINPIVYVVSQKKYKVRKNITSIVLFALCKGRYYLPERQSTDLFQERDRTEI